MTDRDDIDPRAHRVLADVSRVAVLDALRRADRLLAVPEIAARVGLHPNTVRGHLAQLMEYGYVTGGREDRARPGRPRTLYAATGKRDDGERCGHRLLAEALIAYLGRQGGDRGAAAVAAGQAYGERAVGSGAPPGAVDAAATGPAGATDAAEASARAGAVDATEAVRRVVALLADAGFEPRASADGSRIELYRCPFRELADADPEVACGVHLGIMQGALAALGAPVQAAGLRPWARPGVCEATLRIEREAPEVRDGRD